MIPKRWTAWLMLATDLSEISQLCLKKQETGQVTKLTRHIVFVFLITDHLLQEAL